MTVGNTERAAWAQTAIDAFRDQCRGSRAEDGSWNIEEAAGDLIGNLLHLCDQKKLDPLKIMQCGIAHYIAEKIDPNDPDGLSHDVKVEFSFHSSPSRSDHPRTPVTSKGEGTLV